MRSTMDRISRRSAGGVLDAADTLVVEVVELLDRHLDPADETEDIAPPSVNGEQPPPEAALLQREWSEPQLHLRRSEPDLLVGYVAGTLFIV